MISWHLMGWRGNPGGAQRGEVAAPLATVTAVEQDRKRAALAIQLGYPIRLRIAGGVVARSGRVRTRSHGGSGGARGRPRHRLRLAVAAGVHPPAPPPPGHRVGHRTCRAVPDGRVRTVPEPARPHGEEPRIPRGTAAAPAFRQRVRRTSPAPACRAPGGRCRAGGPAPPARRCRTGGCPTPTRTAACSGSRARRSAAGRAARGPRGGGGERIYERAQA